MYRIRSAQGTETVYDSLEEFSVAVKRGAVTPNDEIFHSRAGRWLDIKSHPHYRSALTFNGSHAGPATAGVSAAPPSAPRPASGPQPIQHRPAPDRPAPSQTTIRPQLQAAAPNNGAAATYPPQKSKELTFIAVDGTVVPPASQRNATIIEVPKAVVRSVPRPTPPPAPKPKPEVQAGPSGDDFLVMDGGIESPVRTSSGHRTVSDDLNVLFDAPLPEALVRPAAAPKAPAAPKQAEPPKPVAAPATTAPVKPLASPAPSPKPAEKAPWSLPVSGSSPAMAAPPVPAAKPITSGARLALTEEVDLDIPGGPLTAEVVSELPIPAAKPISSSPKPTLIAGGVAAMALIGVLGFWRPWQGTATTDAAAQAGPAGAGGQASPVIPPAGYTGTVPTPSPAPAQEPTGIKPVPTIGPPVDSVAEQPREQVIAAVRPNFRADAVISTADIGLSTGSTPAKVTAIAPSELARRVVAAERIAQQELAVRVGAAGFRSVLAPVRISTAEGAASARNAWAAGADAIRQYRGRIGRIEKAYEDSMLMSQRAERWPAEELRAWGARQSLAEPGDVSQLADLMVSQITEGLDLLAAMSGQYDIKNGVITFRSPGAETRYTSIRNWVEQRMQNWSATPEAARPHSISLILKALGEGLPAVK